MSGDFPDPGLTANLYCSGSLEAAVFGAVAPFWRELRSRDPEGLCYLWWVRYGRRGEHLKLRLHGPGALLDESRTALADRVETFLASLPLPAGSPQGAADSGPPVDPEDAGTDLLERTLLWTTYRRSHIFLGGKPFLDDDRYVALFTRCLAAGCEMMLALEPGPGGVLSSTQRRNALLEALIEALPAFGFPAGKQIDYLAYHRDWLLRSMLPKHLAADPGASGQLRRFFDERINGRAGALTALGGIVAATGRREESASDGPAATWRRSLAALRAHISPLCQDPDYRLEPFASDPVFAPVFKLLHGTANQLGVSHREEAFTCHMLLRALAGQEAALSQAS